MMANEPQTQANTGEATRVDAQQTRAELEAIRQANAEGMLLAEEVVDWAQANPESELHKQFTWDVTAAARQHWIDQARQIIRVQVTIEPQTKRTVRAYVSLPSDRTHDGGYRDISAALARGRMEMVSEALAKLRRFRNQFSHLAELDPLWQAVDQEISNYEAQRLKAAG